MKHALKQIWNAVTTVVVILIVILALLLVGVRLVGFQVFTVLSGSMEPAYKTGSLIYVKDVDPFTLAEGDVITFMLDEDTVATHRIVGVVPDETDPNTVRFRTKGDANNYEDGQLVHNKNVIGTPVFTIPGLGYVANYIQHPPGLYFSIAAAVVILLLAFLPDLFDDEKPEKKKTKKSPNPKASLVQREVAPRSGDGGIVTSRKRPTPVTTPQSSRCSDSSPCTGEPKRKRPAPPAQTPRPKRSAPVEEEMTFDLEDILADFRNP